MTSAMCRARWPTVLRFGFGSVLDAGPWSPAPRLSSTPVIAHAAMAPDVVGPERHGRFDPHRIVPTHSCAFV